MKNIKDIYHLRERKGEIGIEIEMEGDNLLFHDLDPYWRADGDGSLRGNAVEYVLDRPCSKNKVNKRLMNLMEIIKDSSFDISDRCGVHIHVNCQTMTYEETMCFIIIYLAVENILMKYCGDNREGNMFCLRSSDAEGLIRKLMYAKSLGSLTSLQDPNILRYASINISSIQKYGSLEFRGLQTPMDVNLLKIEEWVIILLCVKKYALEIKNPEIFIKNYSLFGPKTLLYIIFGSILVDKLNYPEMDVDLMNGIRRVQDVIYTKKKKGADAEVRTKMEKKVIQLKRDNLLWKKLIYNDPLIVDEGGGGEPLEEIEDVDGIY